MKKARTALEKAIEMIFLTCACISILSVAVISIYLFVKGTPAIFEIGVFKFLTGTEWLPNSNRFGILPMIIASVYATFGATIIGIVVGLFTAIFLAEFAPSWLVRIFRPAVELLAGIPSVVYGFFGLVVVIPMIRNYIGGVGNSLLAVIFILSIMILPTITSVSETAIRAVSESYKEGSLALGATRVQTVFKVTLPAARSGIMAAIVLGIGRALGETMAVILVAGNTVTIPGSLLDPVRTLTANIALEMGYASGLHREALFATGVVLFVFIMILNIALNITTHKRGEH